MTNYQVENRSISMNSPLPVATSFVEDIGSGTISSLNGYVEIDVSSKELLTFQVIGTWTCTYGGIYIQATNDGINWITLNSNYQILDTKTKDFGPNVQSGCQCIYKSKINGFDKIRLTMLGDAMTGSVTINYRVSVGDSINASEVAGNTLTAFFTETGDNTGTLSYTGNYSSVNKTIFYQPPANKKVYVHQLVVTISDNAQFNQTDYGAINGGLTNGYTFQRKTNGVTSPVGSGTIIKSNLNWYSLTSNITLSTFNGTAQTLVAGINYMDYFGVPAILNGKNGDQFIVTLKDDFTGLVGHTFLIRGRMVDV